MNGLVAWPSPEGKFTDTGDGALHAFLVFRDRDGRSTKEACAFALKPTTITGIADGDVEENELFPRYKLVNADPKLENMISAPFMAVVGLGSTEYSLWDTSSSEYFGVTSGSLTEKGEMLVRILSDVYRSEPIFITCLVPA